MATLLNKERDTHQEILKIDLSQVILFCSHDYTLSYFWQHKIRIDKYLFQAYYHLLFTDVTPFDILQVSFWLQGYFCHEYDDLSNEATMQKGDFAKRHLAKLCLYQEIVTVVKINEINCSTFR